MRKQKKGWQIMPALFNFFYAHEQKLVGIKRKDRINFIRKALEEEPLRSIS